MILETQIITLLYSFLYGVIVYLLLEFNCKLLYDGKLLYRIVISFLFIMLISILYFLGLIKINDGVLHIYFFISLFTGYVSSFVIYNKINCKKK